MQQEEPYNTRGLSALDDYMAALLRDDSTVTSAADADFPVSLELGVEPPQISQSTSAPSEPDTPCAQGLEPTPADAVAHGPAIENSEPFADVEPIANPEHHESLAPLHSLPASTVKAPRLPAEAIPADVALSPVQKYSLQQLLDRQMNTPASEFEDARPPENVPAAGLGTATESEMDFLADDAAEFAQVPSIVTEQEVVEEELSESTLDEDVTQTCGSELEAIKSASQKTHREHWGNGLPEWGSQRFDVLLFSCRKVNLAIPLISLGHIYLERGSLTQMPSLPPWVLGVKASAGGNLKVIDAGAYFMPERAVTLDTDDELHIVSLAGSQWAFAVDTVANPISMNVEDVQWRSFSPLSPWLAGAIKREMCVLIDPQALLHELERSSLAL